MKNKNIIALAATLALVPAARAGQGATNDKDYFALSARFGFNISATLGPVTSFPVRRTPDGLAYNYDDGYVLADASGSGDGLTHNWGYDNSDTQDLIRRDGPNAPNAVEFTRHTLDGGVPSSTFGCDSVGYGYELLYRHELGGGEDLRCGFELAFNYLNLCLSQRSTRTVGAHKATDLFGYEPGTRPPGATPANPYLGTLNADGFLLDLNPLVPTANDAISASIAGNHKFEADIWGFKLGPYINYPINETLAVSFSGGIAAVIVDGRGSWSEAVTFSDGYSISTSGNGGACKTLWGGYAAASVTWQLDEHWNLIGSAQYQAVNKYVTSFGGRSAVLDMQGSVFLTVGLGCSF